MLRDPGLRLGHAERELAGEALLSVRVELDPQRRPPDTALVLTLDAHEVAAVAAISAHADEEAVLRRIQLPEDDERTDADLRRLRARRPAPGRVHLGADRGVVRELVPALVGHDVLRERRLAVRCEV